MSSRTFLSVLWAISLLLLSPGVRSETPPAGTRLLTLEEALRQAEEQNPELKALSSETDVAKAKISRARYWDDTMVGVRFYQVPFEGGFDATEDIDYIIRQTFPVGGKDKAMSKMAFHEYQRLTHQWHGRALEILRDLKSTYYQLFAVQRMIGVSREIEGTLRSMVKNTQSRVASDQAMASDATLGQTEIAKILTERQALFQRQKELSAKLKQILADFSVEEIRLPEKLESPSWDAELKSLMETAQTLHPSIQGSQQQVEQTRWGVKSAKRDYIPDFQVQSEYVQRPGGRVDAFTGELMLNVPLILRKKNRQLQQAEAELASAQFNKQNTMNSVFAKIQEIHAKMKASQAMLNINRRTYLPQARQAFQMTSRAYSTGQVGFVDVLSAVRMLFDAQTEYWKAFEEQAASVFELEEAVGLTREEYASFKKE